MDTDTIETKANWSFWESYDWRCWASWRALLLTAAIIGFMCGSAGLLAEFVVRDLLGLELGRVGPGRFDLRAFAPDLLALAAATSLIIPGYWLWIRGPRIVADQAERPAAAPREKVTFKHRLPDLLPFVSWFVVTFAIYFSIYAGANLILITRSNAGLTPGIALIAFIMGTSSLHAGLRRLGAARQ